MHIHPNCLLTHNCWTLPTIINYNSYCSFIALHRVASVQINIVSIWRIPIVAHYIFPCVMQMQINALNSDWTVYLPFLEFTVCWSIILKYKTHRSKYAKMVEQSKPDADNFWPTQKNSTNSFTGCRSYIQPVPWCGATVCRLSLPRQMAVL